MWLCHWNVERYGGREASEGANAVLKQRDQEAREYAEASQRKMKAREAKEKADQEAAEMKVAEARRLAEMV